MTGSIRTYVSVVEGFPSWAGLLSADLKGRINAFLRQLYKCGFRHSVIDTEHMSQSYTPSMQG